MKVAASNTVCKLVEKLVAAIADNCTDDPLTETITEILDKANEEDAIRIVDEDKNEKYIEIDDEVAIMILTGAIAATKGSKLGVKSRSESFFNRFKKKDEDKGK